MNYIELINQFWQLRRSKRITNLQADVYFFLLNESSSRGSGNNWENPFQCSNGIVCTSIGISEKSMIDARNVLQQLGLISFEGGVTKKKSPTYFIPESLLKVSNQVSIGGSIPGGNPVSIPGGNQANIIKEETKQNSNETKESGASAPPHKSFKKFSDEDFKEEIRAANEGLNLPDAMLHKFHRYWSEPTASGMMKFQTEKTWETKRRLETWRDNQAKFEGNGNNRTGAAKQPLSTGRTLFRDKL